MTKVLLVLSSVRQGRAADNVLEATKKQLATFDNVQIDVADFRNTPLPLFDSAVIPSMEEFAPDDANVQSWTKQVEEANLVIMLVAEYNHSYTAVLKNAIDWVFKPWNDKPVALISYGWAGGTRATKHLRGVLGSSIATRLSETEVNLYFTKDIDTEGNIIADTATESIKTLLDANIG